MFRRVLLATSSSPISTLLSSAAPCSSMLLSMQQQSAKRVVQIATRQAGRRTMTTGRTVENTASEYHQAGVLPDGRVSLRHAFFGGEAASNTATNKSSTFANHWLSDPSTYPIILVMAGALSILTVASVNTLLREPDVCFNKAHRSEMIRSNFDEGSRWHQEGTFGVKKTFMGKDASHNSIFSPLKSFNNKEIH